MSFLTRESERELEFIYIPYKYSTVVRQHAPSNLRHMVSMWWSHHSKVKRLLPGKKSLDFTVAHMSKLYSRGS